MPCGYCDVPGHSIDVCPKRQKERYGTDPDGFETVELRDEETRDDDNTHAKRNAEQKRIAERELEDDEPGIRTDGGSVHETEVVEEWQAVPTRSHPDADVDERYPCSPGPSDGLTEEKARQLARGRNRSGDPSPVVTWHAEPTGRKKPRDDLFDADRSQNAGGESDVQ